MRPQLAQERFADLPSGRFGTIVVDPPWPQSMTRRWQGRHKRPDFLPYKTASVADIREFPVSDVALPGAHVYLWTTNKFLRDAFGVLDAWKCRFHLVLPMVKPSGIAPCGAWVFASEFCLLGFFYGPMLPFTSIGKLNWFKSACVRGKHSVKPDEFYQRVEVMSPGPRLDCFARRERDGWTVWGDQVQKQEAMLWLAPS